MRVNLDTKNMEKEIKDVYYNNLYDECNNFIGDGKFGCLLTDIKQSQDVDERKQVFCSLYNLDRAYGLQKMPVNLRQEKSKIILFARDDKIKDPYIMKQIQNAD